MKAPTKARPQKRVQKAKPPKSVVLLGDVSQRFRAAVYCYADRQTDVARELDITPQQLNKALTGTSYPDEEMIVRFCDNSGFTLDWIYRGRVHSIIPRDMAMRMSELYPDLLPDHEACALAEIRAAIAAGSDAAQKAVTAERARVAEEERAARADALSVRSAPREKKRRTRGKA